jgi:hypothetical protein
MTDVLDRLLEDGPYAEEPTATTAKATKPPFTVTDAGRILLATLSGAAAAVHFVMVPSHMDEWAVEGVAFALAGVFQVVTAVAVVRRPSRLLLWAMLLANAAFVGAWAMSRTSGLPWGPHSWHAETMSIVDLSVVAFEAVLVLLAGIFLLRPGLAGRWRNGNRFLRVAIPLTVIALTMFVITSAEARNHAHGSHGDHAEAGAAGHAHDEGEAAGHSHDDPGLGFSELSNGHHHEIVEHELSPMTQARLDEQLAITQQVAARYPTVADAEAAGYRLAGGYSPGLGAHYISYGGASFMNADGTMNRDDLEHPLSIIYDGTDPDSEVAGFMYYSFADLENEPAGFIGPNDVWHYHENLCLKMGPNGIEAPFGMDNEATQAQCDSVGGYIMPITQWMVHVWSVPGYENEHGGVFGEHNAKLTCPDGTYYQDPPEEWVNTPLTTCRT